MRSPSSRAARPPRPPGGLTLGRAFALGALHGPAELWPISSSAHVTLVPWLLGGDPGAGAAALGRAFEVALHAGTAAGLLLGRRARWRELTGAGRRRLLVAACAPPALAGYALAERIERQLARPGTIAAALALGGVVMLVADRRPQTRRCREADGTDGLWLGLAQAAALVPGVSRAGATTAAARLLRFARRDAGELSELVALPVLLGAAAHQAVGLRRRELEPRALAPLAAGAAASLASTLACGSLAERDRPRRLAPFALYRMLLAGLVFIRLRRAATARPPAPAPA